MPVSTWLAAGATTVGVGAALLTGAAAANAKPASNSSSSDSSQHSGPSHAKPSHSRPSRPARPHQRAASAADSGAPDKADKKAPNTKRNNNNRPAADAGRKSAASASVPAPLHTKPAVAAAEVPTVTTTPDNPRREHLRTLTTAPTTTTDNTGSAAVVSTAAVDTPALSISGGSAVAKAAPSRAADASGVLSVFAAMGQALTVSVRHTERALANAARDTALTLNGPSEQTDPAATPAAAPAANSITSIPTGLTTPVTPVDTLGRAIQEIQAAQAAFHASSSWSRMTNGYSAWLLGIALKNLNQYQANQDTLMATYAANPTAANLKKLQANEALPAHAVKCLKMASSWSGISGLKANAKLAAADGLVYGSVPLTMYLGTEPIIKLSINGGPMIKVLVDTGSSGLVLPAKYAGSVNTLGQVVGSGTSGFGTGVGSANIVYDFDQYNTTVDFGNGLKTGTVTVNVVTAATQSGYMNYIGQNGVVGVLGIGTNAVGPGGSIVSTALPGLMSSGVFIDEKNKKLWFGPNPLPVVKSVPGSPNVTGYISVNGNNKTPVNMLLDSGGVFGTIPQAIAGNATATDPWGGTVLAKGSIVTVYAADGTTVLFTYTVPSTSQSPTVTVNTNPQALNTGYQPFKLGPMYINYVDGVTTITDEDGVTTTYYGQTDFDY